MRGAPRWRERGRLSIERRLLRSLHRSRLSMRRGACMAFRCCVRAQARVRACVCARVYDLAEVEDEEAPCRPPPAHPTHSHTLPSRPSHAPPPRPPTPPHTRPPPPTPPPSLAPPSAASQPTAESLGPPSRCSRIQGFGSTARGPSPSRAASSGGSRASPCLGPTGECGPRPHFLVDAGPGCRRRDSGPPRPGTTRPAPRAPHLGASTPAICGGRHAHRLATVAGLAWVTDPARCTCRPLPPPSESGPCVAARRAMRASPRPQPPSPRAVSDCSLRAIRVLPRPGPYRLGWLREHRLRLAGPEPPEFLSRNAIS